MFTDMVGYTALGQRNEPLALLLAEEHRRVTRPILGKHHGREVKTMGDAFLVEFLSALEAVRCAYEIQQGIWELNLAKPRDERLSIRIGIHLGDVVESDEEGKDIFGDAVNIASRIEPLAENGGVCISRQVYDQVSNKLEFRIDSLGPRTLKSLSAPLEVFKIVMPWENAEVQTSLRQTEAKRIAVLPFANMSPDPDDIYFSDGVTEELITSLSGIKELTVIARTSVMKYRATQKGVSEIAKELNVGTLIEGSVRKAGGKVRITVQLVNAATEGHVWAQNYDRQLDDIFAIQSEIAESVAKELSVRLMSSERARLEKKPTEDPGVYMLYLKGRHFWNERSDEGLSKAISYFQKAVDRDRGFALGYSGLADCYVVMARNGPLSASDYERARENTERALELDPDLAEAHAARASILVHYDYAWREAEAEYKKAIELKPNYSTGHQWYAHLLVIRGRIAEAQREMTIAIKLDPLSVIMNHNMGATYYYQGKFDEALVWFERANELNPTVLLASHGATNKIQAYALSGRLEEAEKELERVEAMPRKITRLLVWRAYLHAAMKKEREVRKELLRLEEEHNNGTGSSYMIGMVYFVLGDNDKGFEWLKVAYDERDGGVPWMMRDHEFAGVRKDPRFIALQKAIGLENVQTT